MGGIGGVGVCAIFVTNCYEKCKGWGMSGYFSYITPKYLVECFSFSLSDECSVVPDALNLFNKFLTTYCMFEEIEDWFLSIFPFYKRMLNFCLASIFFKFSILSLKLFLKYFWVRQAVIPSEEQGKVQLFVASS